MHCIGVLTGTLGDAELVVSNMKSRHKLSNLTPRGSTGDGLTWRDLTRTFGASAAEDIFEGGVSGNSLHRPQRGVGGMNTKDT